MVLSGKTKEAIKTALAMTITYGIALSMDWDKPLWAGLVVAIISMDTIGQSLNKGAMRMFGTLVGAVMALILLALFIQDRWLFLLALSAWIGFCTYMMGGAKYQYFWNMCGLVCVIIALDAGADSANAFATATLRAQQTGLGVLVYSLVVILLWPSNSRAQFEAVAHKRALSQHRLYRAYLGQMNNTGSAEDIQAIRAELMQEQTRFGQLLNAAESDSAEVSELSPQWRRYQRQAMQLSDTLERWRESFTGLQGLDLQRLVPNLEAFCGELDRRLGQVGRMLDNQAPEHPPGETELLLDPDEAHGLGHFDRAALMVARTRLQQIEALTRKLFGSVAEIKGFDQGDANAVSAEQPASTPSMVPDPERLAAVARVVVTLWLASFALIYIDAVPGGSTFVIIACALAMATAYLPQLGPSILYRPVAIGISFATVLYIFVMPRLSGFVELGLLLFAVTFTVHYLLASPKQALARILGLVMFIAIASITNQQTYSFFSFATLTLMFVLVFLLLTITAYIPVSTHPEHVFLRMLGRFFRSSGYLVMAAVVDSTHADTRLARWKTAYHARELAALPAKLGTWVPHLGTGTSQHKAQALVTSLQSLSGRVQELLEERGSRQHGLAVQEVGEAIQAWNLAICKTFQHFAQDMALEQPDTLRSRLDAMLDRLETNIKSALETTGKTQFSAGEAEKFYRLLGAYRGLSEALLDYAENAGEIDWVAWREEQFVS